MILDARPTSPSHGDIKVAADGNVILSNEGMSVYSEVVEIYPGRLPVKNGGQNEDDVHVFRMGEGPFVTGIPITPHLIFFYPGQGFHGMLVPANVVHLDVYRQHLAETKESWELYRGDGNVS
jgi:hypothetical protein